jgi:hypothetical protein
MQEHPSVYNKSLREGVYEKGHTGESWFAERLGLIRRDPLLMIKMEMCMMKRM